MLMKTRIDAMKRVIVELLQAGEFALAHKNAWAAYKEVNTYYGRLCNSLLEWQADALEAELRSFEITAEFALQLDLNAKYHRSRIWFPIKEVFHCYYEESCKTLHYGIDGHIIRKRG